MALTDSKILKTTDSGRFWQNVIPVHAPIFNSSNADFMNMQDAWIATATAYNTVIVMRTTDGGAHWQNVAINDGSDETVVNDMPHFINANEGWLDVITNYSMATQTTSSAIFHTTDGGQHWNLLADYRQLNQEGFVVGGIDTGISFKDAHTLWATENPIGFVPRTGRSTIDHVYAAVSHDGGKTWHPQVLPTLPGLNHMHYKTTPPIFFGNTGIMPVYVHATNRDLGGLVVYKSNDGGAHWYTLNFVHLTPNMVNLSDTQHIWTDTPNGEVFATTNDGLSWNKIAALGYIGDLDFITLMRRMVGISPQPATNTCCIHLMAVIPGIVSTIRSNKLV